MVKKIWGVNVRDIWTIENGQPFEPDDYHPVSISSPYEELVIGIRRDNEEEAVVIHSYDPSVQPGASRGFARMVWKARSEWTAPDYESRIVQCLGAPACEACPGSPLPAMETVPNWRVQPFILDNKLTATHLLDPLDPECSLTTEPHLITEVVGETDPNKLNKELWRRAVGLFGAPYDEFTEERKPWYVTVR